MRLVQLVAVVGFALTTPAWSGESVAAPVHGGSVLVSSLPAVQQRVKGEQAEVVRLEHEVARQKSASQRASRRLQQQDHQIAELQRQLSSGRDSPAVGQP